MISDLKLIVVLCPMLGLAVAGLVPAGCDDDALRRWREVSDRSVDGLLEHRDSQGPRGRTGQKSCFAESALGIAVLEAKRIR